MKKKLPFLSLAQIQHLNDKDFADYLVALFQLSNEDVEAEHLARAIWVGLEPEQRIIMLKFMGMKGKSQGRA